MIDELEMTRKREISRESKNEKNRLISTIVWGFIFLLAKYILVAAKKLQDEFAPDELRDFQLNYLDGNMLGVVAGAGSVCHL